MGTRRRILAITPWAVLALGLLPSSRGLLPAAPLPGRHRMPPTCLAAKKKGGGFGAAAPKKVKGMGKGMGKAKTPAAAPAAAAHIVPTLIYDALNAKVAALRASPETPQLWLETGALLIKVII